MNQELPHSNEIDIVFLFQILWKRKYIIIGITFFFTATGIYYALTSRPLYYSEAIITPKRQEKNYQMPGGLSQLGGLMSSQLSLTNNDLNRLAVIAGSRDLAKKVILKNDLMPALFPALWDTLNQTWLDSLQAPDIRDGVKQLRQTVMKISKDELGNTLSIRANHHDSIMAKNIVDYYLNALNKRLREDVIKDANHNKKYLEHQLLNTTDPFITEKIQNMIAYEIHKSMLVNSKSIDILDNPEIPKLRFKPNRKAIALISLIIGLTISCIGVLLFEGILRSRKNE